MSIDDEARPSAEFGQKLEKLIARRSINRVLRADAKELAVELDDGSRLFVRVRDGALDISVT